MKLFLIVYDNLYFSFVVVVYMHMLKIYHKIRKIDFIHLILSSINIYQVQHSEFLNFFQKMNGSRVKL